jgi:hypothetical protein
MSEPAEQPKRRPRPTAEQKAEWDAAFAEATGRPPVDPETDRVYGILALGVAAVGTVAAGGFAWDWPSFGLSICFMTAFVGRHLAKRDQSTVFGQHALKWCFWLYVALVPGMIWSAVMYSMRFVRATSLFDLNIPL